MTFKLYSYLINFYLSCILRVFKKQINNFRYTRNGAKLGNPTLYSSLLLNKREHCLIVGRLKGKTVAVLGLL